MCHVLPGAGVGARSGQVPLPKGLWGLWMLCEMCTVSLRVWALRTDGCFCPSFWGKVLRPELSADKGGSPPRRCSAAPT